MGDNARIAAGAVVLRDVPAGATAVGVPAQVVRLNGEKVPRPVDELDHTGISSPTAQRLEDLAARLTALEQKWEQSKANISSKGE